MPPCCCWVFVRACSLTGVYIGYTNHFNIGENLHEHACACTNIRAAMQHSYEFYFLSMLMHMAYSMARLTDEHLPCPLTRSPARPSIPSAARWGYPML